MAVSLEQFSQQLADSGLLSEQDLRAFLDKLPEAEKPVDGEQLAKRLVKEKQISAYQAQVVYSGKGKTLTMGSYFVLDKLGQGGMGMVLKAEHRMMKRLVAIKVLSPSVTKTKELSQRFQREVEAAARLTHLNIVGAFDAGETNGSPFLVMEYVPGDDLASIVKKKGPLSVDQAIDCIAQAAKGLEFAHSQGVIHRDIKPANLLMDTKGVVKILDMGLARIETTDVATQADLTGTGAVMGTVDYMAPEQALSTKHADARSDLYSLGISLWYLLTGKPAYEGDSLMARLLAHREQPIPSLRAVREDASESLDHVFQKLVAKKQVDRYQTATELLVDLQACRTGASIKAVTVAEIATGPDEFQNFLQHIESPTEGPRGSRTNPSVTGTKTLSRSQVSVTSADETMPPVPLSETQRLRRPKVQKAKSPPWFQDRRVQISGGAVAALILMAVVFLFQTPSGTLRVEILDPEVEMRVKGTELTFHGPDLGPVSLKTGEKKLLVTRGDLSFETESFAINKGKEFRVKAELVGDKLVINGGGKVIARQPIKPHGLTTSTTGSNPVASMIPGSNAAAPPPAIAPFDAEQARKHQEAWADYLGLPVEFTNALGMKFRLIPPGEFAMGSTQAEIDATLKEENPNDKHWQACIKSEGPQHKVILTRPIYLGVNEVTQAEYLEVMGTNPSHFSANGPGKDRVAGVDTSLLPVERVSWSDVAEFCAKLSLRQQLKPFYLREGETIKPLDGTGYRLPSEAEWEFACRAGTVTKYWSGDQDADLARAGWYAGNSGSCTHPPGAQKANPFGLFEMHGNVWEWVQDGWEQTWYGRSQNKPASDPYKSFSSSSSHSARGGSWNDPGRRCSASRRIGGDPTARLDNLGFRVALPVEAAKQQLPQGTATAPKLAVAPFDAVQARKHQEAWAAYLGFPVEFTNTLGMKFRLIPPGEFMMGITPEQFEVFRKILPDEPGDLMLRRAMPAHLVRITKPFYLQVGQVRLSQFTSLLDRKPPVDSELDTNDNLWRGVSWYDAIEFCNKLGEKEKRQLVYTGSGAETRLVPGAVGYRLPTEAEFEFACRAGTDTFLYFGNDAATIRAHVRYYSGDNVLSNPFGLTELYGGSSNWCWDAAPQNFDSYSPEQLKQTNDPFVDAGPWRVRRGGTFFASGGQDPGQNNSFYRSGAAPELQHWSGLGRIVLMIPERAASAATSPPRQPIQQNGDAIDYALERDCAEWLRSHQNAIEIRIGDQFIMIEHDMPLPAENFILDKSGRNFAGPETGAAIQPRIDKFARLHRFQGGYLPLVASRQWAAAYAKMPHVTHINAYRTDLEDDDLGLFAAMPKLDYLSVDECQKLTGKGIRLLATSRSLRWINLWDMSKINNSYTLEDVQALQDALPLCKITKGSGKPIPGLMPAKSQ